MDSKPVIFWFKNIYCKYGLHLVNILLQSDYSIPQDKAGMYTFCIELDLLTRFYMGKENVEL